MKLIALDLDGTLLNSDKVVSQRNFAALSRAAEQGHVIVPATRTRPPGDPGAGGGVPVSALRYYDQWCESIGHAQRAVLLRAEIALDTCLRLLDFAALL